MRQEALTVLQIPNDPQGALQLANPASAQARVPICRMMWRAHTGAVNQKHGLVIEHHAGGVRIATGFDGLLVSPGETFVVTNQITGAERSRTGDHYGAVGKLLETNITGRAQHRFRW